MPPQMMLYIVKIYVLLIIVGDMILDITMGILQYVIIHLGTYQIEVICQDNVHTWLIHRCIFDTGYHDGILQYVIIHSWYLSNRSDLSGQCAYLVNT